MRKATILRILLAITLVAVLALPAVASAAPPTKSTGSFTYSAMGEYPDDDWDLYRWDHAWNVTDGSGKKSDRGTLTLKKYLLEDDGVPVGPTLLDSWTFAVTEVIPVDSNTIDFYSFGSWGYSGSQAQYYSTGWWRVTGGRKNAQLSYKCDVCGVYHSMNGTAVH